jgi:hypothetical protein
MRLDVEGLRIVVEGIEQPTLTDRLQERFIDFLSPNRKLNVRSFQLHSC